MGHISVTLVTFWCLSSVTAKTCRNTGQIIHVSLFTLVTPIIISGNFYHYRRLQTWGQNGPQNNRYTGYYSAIQHAKTGVKTGDSKAGHWAAFSIFGTKRSQVQILSPRPQNRCKVSVHRFFFCAKMAKNRALRLNIRQHGDKMGTWGQGKMPVFVPMESEYLFEKQAKKAGKLSPAVPMGRLQFGGLGMQKEAHRGRDPAHGAGKNESAGGAGVIRPRRFRRLALPGHRRDP